MVGLECKPKKESRIEEPDPAAAGLAFATEPFPEAALGTELLMAAKTTLSAS